MHTYDLAHTIFKIRENGGKYWHIVFSQIKVRKIATKNQEKKIRKKTYKKNYRKMILKNENQIKY